MQKKKSTKYSVSLHFREVEKLFWWFLIEESVPSFICVTNFVFAHIRCSCIFLPAWRHEAWRTKARSSTESPDPTPFYWLFTSMVTWISLLAFRNVSSQRRLAQTNITEYTTDLPSGVNSEGLSCQSLTCLNCMVCVSTYQSHSRGRV